MGNLVKFKKALRQKVGDPGISIKAEAMLGGELKAGDLFSTADQEYWDGALEGPSIGERVYIRTNSPTPPQEAKVAIFRIAIVREERE